MKYKLIAPNYDMKVGTFWYDAGPCIPQPGQGESRVVTEIDGDRTQGALRIVEVRKLEEVKE
jgi:hypothetical protein